MKRSRLLAFIIVAAILMEICSLGAVYAAEETDPMVPDTVITEKAVLSDETIPEDDITDEVIPENTDPNEELPEEEISEETVAEEIEPEEEVPEETVAEEIELEEEVPEETVTEDTDQGEELPEEEVSEETVSEETGAALDTPDEIIPEETEQDAAEPEEDLIPEETAAEEPGSEEIPEEAGDLTEIETADTINFQMNNIPVIYINIDESRGTIEKMNSSIDHSENCYGSIDIMVPDGYSSEYMDGLAQDIIELDLEYIRGRGNSSWYLDKKPYKLKLDESTDLFGMGKNKHWVLLANRMDVTLIKNRITFWLSDAIGLEYTPQCIPVDVVMNGTYIGSYLLAEQVRVGKSRVNIPELKEEITEEPDVTGGYLLALGGTTHDGENYIRTEKGVDLVLESPDFEDDYENDIQKQYITEYLQMMENAIFGEDFCDSEGNSYTEYLDIDSAIDYWWIQEFAKNPDGFFTTSNYLYKDRDDKIYFGPIWDFDAAWQRQESRPAGMPSTRLITWYRCLFTDPYFAEKTISRWSTIREYIEDLIEEGGVIDRYYEETKASQKYDEELWGIYGSDEPIWDDFNIPEEQDTELDDAEPSEEDTYKNSIETLRTWIIERRDWIDENVNNILNMIHSVKFVDEDSTLDTRYVEDGDRVYQYPEVPEKEGLYFLGWYADDGEKYDESVSIEKNLVLNTSYIENSKVTRGQVLYFAEDHLYVPSVFYNKIVPFTVLPEDAIDKSVVWSSSDESVVSVDKDGYIYMKGIGTVTITGTLSSGKSYSYTVTSFNSDGYEDDVPVEEIAIDNSSLKLQPGEYGHIGVQVLPIDSTVHDISFSSENPEIATVSEGGVVKGISKGTTRIIVSEDWSDKYTICEVTVGDEEESDPPAPEEDDPEPQKPDDEPVYPVPDSEPEIPDSIIDDGNAGYKPAGSGHAPGKDVPKTGDEQNMYLWLVLMTAAALILSVCITAFVRKAERR